MKKILCVLFALVMCFTVSVVSFADGEVYPRLVDQGEILTDSEEAEVLSKLNSVSDKHKCDIVIVTVETLDGEDVEVTSNSLYEIYGYADDCLLFLLAMDTRDWAVSKNGFALTAFTNAGFDYIFEKIKSDLGADNYSAAFTSYADLCDDFLAQAKTGNPYTADNLPKDPFDTVMNLIICIVIGLVIAFIVTGVMKGQLKSVRFQSAASDYTKAGSMQVNESRDFYLYSTVSRREKKQENSSGSSSGGSSRNQSGKF